MKKIIVLAVFSVYVSSAFAQLSQNDKNYMSDLNYIEGQKLSNEVIQKNIKRQPEFADYFSMAVKNKEIILMPFNYASKEQVQTIVDSVKNQLQYDNVIYEDVIKQGTKTVKAHLIYKQKPMWAKSTIFD